MRNILFVCAGLLLAATLASAQSQTVSGTLIDNMCFSKNMKMSQEELAGHSRECALMDGCIKSGYAVVTADGHVYKLDTKGNADAVATLKAAKQAANLKVTVMGTNKGGTLTVSKLMLDR